MYVTFNSFAFDYRFECGEHSFNSENFGTIVYAPINVNPVVGGSVGKGWGFDGEVHPLSGKFDRVPLLGGRDIWFFRQRNWDQD